MNIFSIRRRFAKPRRTTNFSYEKVSFRIMKSPSKLLVW